MRNKTFKLLSLSYLLCIIINFLFATNNLNESQTVSNEYFSKQKEIYVRIDSIREFMQRRNNFDNEKICSNVLHNWFKNKILKYK